MSALRTSLKQAFEWHSLAGDCRLNCCSEEPQENKYLLLKDSHPTEAFSGMQLMVPGPPVEQRGCDKVLKLCAFRCITNSTSIHLETVE